jgi:uncharacterized protein YjbI with pentapeptide repeats
MPKVTPPVTNGTDEFEPPKYLASLIGAINDGAKTAQASLLLFLLVGLYLLATAFSASDEDTLLGKTVTFSQIGASLPASFSFAIAPLVFVFLHVYALTRYDMLGTNVRYLLFELQATVPLAVDRERCRQLLANAEFVQSLTAPRGSSLRSWFWPILAVATMAVFPVVVLLLVQINSLRYQGELINWVQRAWLLIELLAIAVFFARNRLVYAASGSASLFRQAVRTGVLVGGLSLVVALDLVWLNVVPAEADAATVRYDRTNHDGQLPGWRDALRQPLDLGLCPRLNWGCRFLRVDHRTLVEHVWDEKAMEVLRADDVDYTAALTGVEGVVLRERTLRFVMLDDSRLYAADLTGADLTKASMQSTRLQSALLIGAKMSRANLLNARAAGVDLSFATLPGADLTGAHLEGAFLGGANLSGAVLFGARLPGASLGVARLLGADLRFAELPGANLVGAILAGADLRSAKLQGALLRRARLEGASLGGAQLTGADLQNAKAWHAVMGDDTTLDLSDLRGADFHTDPSDSDLLAWEADMAPVPLDAYGQRFAPERLGREFVSDRTPTALRFTADAENPVLVSDANAAEFKSVPTEWLLPEPPTTNGREWQPTLAALRFLNAQSDFLDLTLWSSHPAVAKGIARRLQVTLAWDRSDLPARYAACRLLNDNMATDDPKQQHQIDIMKSALHGTTIDCKAVDKWSQAAAASQ